MEVDRVNAASGYGQTEERGSEQQKKETTCVLLSKWHRWRKLVSDFAERASDIALQ
jgi:hypothetical protein